MLVRVLLILIAVLSAAQALPAQEKAAKPTATSAQFTKVFRDFKEKVGRLAQIQQKYNTATKEEEKKALEEEFNAKVEETKALEPKVAAAAEKAYLEAPNKDNDINEFLLSRLNKLVATDDNEEATRLADVMVENKYERKFFNLFAGLAYFGVNQFDKAEKYLKLADADGDFKLQFSQSTSNGTATTLTIGSYLHIVELYP